MSSINQILCGNHLDILKEYPDGFFDMFLTSPPYDNLRDYEGYDFQFEPLAHELYRTLKPGGIGVWVVNDETKDGSETLTSAKQKIFFREMCGFNIHDTMIYQFAGTGAKGSNLAYWQGFEYMIILSKGMPLTVNRIADHVNVKAGSRNGHIGQYANGTRKERGIRITPKFSVRSNVWRYGGSVGEHTEHPAQFPEKLAEDHILSWSNPGDIVLDPMCGSGTTCKMAVKHGRQYVGIDCAEEYCEISRQRLEKVTAQKTIFDVIGHDNPKQSELF